MSEAEMHGDEKLRKKFGTPDIPALAAIPEDLVSFVESADFFFIATSGKAGECDCSYRGKGQDMPAVKILDRKTMIFPHYLGNGSFRSLGNIIENPHIGMLFIDFRSGLRVRINGDAEITENAEWLKLFPHSLLTVKVTVREAYKQNRPVELPRKGE